MTGIVTAEISVGELIDKITILEIKLAHTDDQDKRRNIETEHQALTAAREANVSASEDLERLTTALKEVNQTLWRIEDEIRDCEREQEFGDRFVTLARSVYRENDRRAALKREVNELTGSRLVEEKLYASY